MGRHRYIENLWRRSSLSHALGRTPPSRLRQQPGGRVASTDTATRARHARLQITRARSALSLDPRTHPEWLSPWPPPDPGSQLSVLRTQAFQVWQDVVCAWATCASASTSSYFQKVDCRLVPTNVLFVESSQASFSRRLRPFRRPE